MKCVVCFEAQAVGCLFCKTCGESYDRDARRDNTVAAAVRWAAKRARRFERQRTIRREEGKR